jgi:hypothetical protein
MAIGVGVCEAVKIAATGPFPIPASYEVEHSADECRVMLRQLGAAKLN